MPESFALDKASEVNIQKNFDALNGKRNTDRDIL